ncbi:MAG: ABC transporter permease [Chitinispirillia bacterium]|nr:ABC transporter permease [Chitinispirillia bacterium]
MNPLVILKLTAYTAADELRGKGFAVLTALSITALIFIRGCFSGDVTINGEKQSAAELGWHLSFFAYHLISVIGMLMAVLVSMRLFKHDESAGSAVNILSGPVSRAEYITGKAAGVWVLSSLFMVTLHFTVYLIVLTSVNGTVPGFMTASLITTLNVLVVTLAVLAFSMVASDIAAALLAIIMLSVSFISDTANVVFSSGAMRQLMPLAADAQTMALWRELWPKIGNLQYGAVSMMQNGQTDKLISSALNLSVYVLLFALLLEWKFRRMEIR